MLELPLAVRGTVVGLLALSRVLRERFWVVCTTPAMSATVCFLCSPPPGVAICLNEPMLMLLPLLSVPVLQLPAQPLLLLLTSPTLAALPAASLNFADRLDFILDAELAILRAAPGARSLCFWNKFVLSVLGEEGQTDMPWSVTCTSTSSSTLNLVKRKRATSLLFLPSIHRRPRSFVGSVYPGRCLDGTQ